jgi:hypothetical protein
MSENHCQCVLKSGPHKGQQCSYKALKGSQFCGRHKTCQTGASKVSPNVSDPQKVHAFLTTVGGGDIQISLSSDPMDWDNITVESQNKIAFPNKVMYTIDLPVGRDDSQGDDPIVYQSIKFQGPATNRQLQEAIDQYYHTHPIGPQDPSGEFKPEQMGVDFFYLIDSQHYRGNYYY